MFTIIKDKMDQLTMNYQSDFVKQLMNQYNRYHFVVHKKDAYIDKPSLLMDNQTISAPHMHSKAIYLMEEILIPGNKILDIGSGSGYLCAVFGEAVGVKNKTKKDRGMVIGIEYHQSLVNYSKEVIGKHYPDLMKYKTHFKIVHGDGKKGYPDKSLKQEYDGIHIGAACDFIPFHLLRQLKRGGIMVIPLKINKSSLQFCILKKDKDGNIHIENTGDVRYVPLL